MSFEDEAKLVFQIEFKNFKATDLKTRHRFREKYRLKILLDEKKFKTEKQPVGGGDVEWKFRQSCEYSMSSQHTSNFVIEFVKRELESRQLKVFLLSNIDEKTSKQSLASLSLDLYTIATGPMEHNLPLLDNENKPVGRLNFSLEMVQVSTVTVIFREIHVKNLKSVEDEVQGVNPYLKYGYSKDWPQIVDGRMKATYSETRIRTMNPSWDDKSMPWLKFRASLNELVKESLVLHVTHKGKIHNTTLGRCNLLFRTLVDGGKSFKEEDLISFKGPLNKKDPDCTIEGKLVFKHLPVFAQMKPLSGGRPALHTEKGIYDAMPLLTWVPKPKEVIINTEKPATSEDAERTITRARSNSDTAREQNAQEVKRQESIKDLREAAQAVQKSKSLAVPKKSEVPTADLLDFDDPPAPSFTRNRAVSHAPHPKMLELFEGEDPFQTPKPQQNFIGVLKPENVLQVQSISPSNPFASNTPTFNPFYPQMAVPQSNSPHLSPHVTPQPVFIQTPIISTPTTFNPFAPQPFQSTNQPTFDPFA